MFLCARGIVVPNQESERSCFCILGVSLYQARKVSDHVLCVRGIAVPSQENERSCFCMLGVSLYQVRKVSDHVFVC